MRFLHLATLMSAALPLAELPAEGKPAQGEPARVAQARQNAAPALGRYFGAPVFIRIIKEDYKLELWVWQNGAWQLAKTYEIAGMSGDLGPKTAEGDCQAPEGFYMARPRGMNPYSSYHLSFNIGYPNRYDKKLGRTGSLIMVHGSDVSIGCFAMTDPGIEEIYTLVNEAFKAGETGVPIQIYPFRMTDSRMEAEKGNPFYGFWQHLLPGWRHTEQGGGPYPDSDN